MESNLIQAIYNHVKNTGRPALLKRVSAPLVKHGFQLLGLLILCWDIAQNPGPRCKYPCRVCLKTMRVNQRGVQCDFCDIWYHVKCVQMNTQIYNALANSSCIWECADCGFPNFSSSLFESLDAIQVTNHFWPLSPPSKSNSTFDRIDKTGINTTKYLTPLGHKSRHVNWAGI